MITSEIKNRIDAIWDTFWTGGITKETLYETTPFSEYDWFAVFGPSAMHIGDFVDNIHSVITPERMRISS